MSSPAGVPVPRRGPKLEPLLLDDDERAVLERWTRRANSAQALALRARIVLACAGPDVPPIVEVARNLRISADTVRKWRRRFLAERMDGLVDEPRPGRPPTIGVDQVEAVVVATLEEIPKNATHWSRKSMAEHSGLSKSTVGRIWRRFQLKPHLTDTFKLSRDPLFVEKVYDVVGLYFNPPEGAVVLSVDEKSQIQALDRSQPVLPIMPGMPERRTHDSYGDLLGQPQRIMQRADDRRDRDCDSAGGAEDSARESKGRGQPVVGDAVVLLGLHGADPAVVGVRGHLQGGLVAGAEGFARRVGLHQVETYDRHGHGGSSFGRVPGKGDGS
jgi:transposase-like protein